MDMGLGMGFWSFSYFCVFFIELVPSTGTGAVVEADMEDTA